MMAHHWQDDLPASALRRGDLVLLAAGHLRVVTAANPARDGRRTIRLGATWYEVNAHKTFAVDRKGAR